MDDRAEPKGQSRIHRERDGGRSASSRRTPLTIGVAVVVGLALGIGVGAAEWGSAPASGAAPAGPTRTLESASASASASASGGSNLYVVDGRSGSATRTGTNSWRINLTGTSVLWFKDRPFRGSGTESASAFVAGWKTDFVGSPPYGAVLAPTGPPGHHPTAVKLTDPTYDPASGTTSFTLTPDKGESKADAAWLSKLTPGAAPTGGRVILFVDNSSPSSSGPLTADDQNIIEYFNQIVFMQDIYIVAVDQGAQYSLELRCPPRETPTLPSPNFLLTMYTADSSSSMTCNARFDHPPQGRDAPEPVLHRRWIDLQFRHRPVQPQHRDHLLQHRGHHHLHPGHEHDDHPQPQSRHPAHPQWDHAELLHDLHREDRTSVTTVSCTNSFPTTPSYSYNSNVYFQTGVAPG